MDIVKIKNKFQGFKFSRLILHQRKSSDIQATVRALQDTMQGLPHSVQPLLESWIGEMGSSIRLGQFWKKDCGEVFDTIVEAADEKLRAAGVEPTDADLFNMFQIIVLNFASATPQSRKSRAMIRKAASGWHPWPIISNILHPALAFIVTLAFSIWGMIADHPYLWIPYTGVLASIVILLANSLAKKHDRLNQWMAANEYLKSLFSLISIYLMLVQVACAVLGFYWVAEQ